MTVPPLVTEFQDVVARQYDGEDGGRLAKVTVDGSGLVVGVTLAAETVRRSASEVASAVREAMAAARGARVKALVDMGSRHGILPRGDV